MEIARSYGAPEGQPPAPWATTTAALAADRPRLAARRHGDHVQGIALHARDPAAPAPTSGDTEWDLPTGSAAPIDETIATRIEWPGRDWPAGGRSPPPW
ncbi:hypothetical protein GCM10010390_43870 [Streptomyces mordarskii]|uniref:Uncharacterized protein n=1 Tax=Streptomyces mordarskii TaxID=1226758 RepID=A0ABN1D8I1_9ACTN